MKQFVPRIVPLIALAVALPCGAADRALNRSDVVFFIDDPAQYEAYGCTAVGWGARPDAAHIQEAHAAGVRHLAASVPFRTGFAGVIDYTDGFLDAACRDFSGAPFAVPWLWDHTHKDQPIWWGCTNSPLYREWLDGYLVKRMAVSPDGLHIDDYTGTAGAVTWLSACFCEHCMAAFREYLKTHVSEAALAELGITDFDAFDYRKFLLDRGVKPEEYKAKRASLPLADAFLDFQAHAVTDYVRAFHARACELRGERVTLSVNSGLSSPMSLMIAPYVDYFCCEVGHESAKGAWPAHPVYIYKLADALDRPVAAMASGQDHAFIAEHECEELLRTWIVTAYSHGQAFTPPTNLWCYTKEKGTHWYKGPAAEYAWMYQFIRANAALFDGYDALAPVAVVYDNAARRAGAGDTEGICAKLERANVPFALVVAGDDWLDYRLTEDKLARFETLLVAEAPEHMDAEQRAVLEQSGRMRVFEDAVLTELPRVTVENGADVAVVLRVKPGDPNAPVVCHVHSRRYDADADHVVPQDKVAIHVPRALLPERAYIEAVVHAPNAEDLHLPVETTDAEIVLRFPQVGLWHVAVL